MLRLLILCEWHAAGDAQFTDWDLDGRVHENCERAQQAWKHAWA